MNQQNSVATITIEMLDLWQAGSGRGEGKHLDSVPVLDAQGLPFLPGRTVKGLLRDAVWHLENIEALSQWSPFAPDTSLTVWLFGSRDSLDNAEDTTRQTRYTSTPGSIWVSDAKLSPGIRDALTDTTTSLALRGALFHDTFSTAIDEKTGQAKNQTLRSKRVCVPMVLTATLESSHAEGLEIIETALPLIDALGSQRTRGLGRCVWTLERKSQLILNSTSVRRAA
jgi:CRISPR/Cas system CSM-associated protein Csm3 (group 7 of RAMP superfamily)